MVTHRGFFSPSFMPLSSLLFWFCLSSSSWLFLLSLCSACVSACHGSFLPHLPPFFSAFYRAKAENAFSTSSACFSKEIHLWSKGWSLGATALCFVLVFIPLSSKLFLGLSLPRISIKHLSSASHWLVSASARHHWDSWLFFLRLFLVPVSQQIFACWKWGSGENWFFLLLCINSLEKTPLPVTVEWNNSWAGSLPLPLGIHPLLSFSLIRTTLCRLNQG